MKELLDEVLKLQPMWTYTNTPDMQRRGKLIRNEIPSWLKSHFSELSAAMGPSGNDLKFEGRDGMGPKSEIPWVRFYSAVRSPNAHQGWYCVYLFNASGSGAYLCICHGSTRYENGEFRPRAPAELATLVHWARHVVSSAKSFNNYGAGIVLGARGELGGAYEQGTAFSKCYEAGGVPKAKVLLSDAVEFSEILGKLYNAEDLGHSPESASLDAQRVQQAVDDIVTPKKTRGGNGQGFGLTHSERCAVDHRAMVVTQEYLTAAGYTLKDVSKSQPYDYIATKNGSSIIVEVKGTTGKLGSVLLTANEVAAHRRQYPANALIIVHAIDLNRIAKPPHATGGVPHMIAPWGITDSSLKPLSYQYTLV